MKTRWFKLIAFLVITLVAVGCAQQRAPVGGPQDKTPPVLLEASPPNNSIHFASAKVVFTFDEFIQLKDVNTKLIVSPPLSILPKTYVRGKHVIMEINNELAPHTTYNFNFSDAIEDLNEGNAIPNFIYAVSTGDYVDSLQVKGHVQNALTGASESGMLVMLYHYNVDSLPLTKKPDYFGRTDKQGNFEIGYLGEGHYKIFALKDMDQNYLYDAPAETIAFSDSLLIPAILDSNSVPFEMRSFNAPDTNQYLKDYKTSDNRVLKAIYNLPADTFFITLPDGRQTPENFYRSFRSSHSDTVTAWVNLPDSTDHLSLVLHRSPDKSDTVSWYYDQKFIQQDTAKLKVATNTQNSRLDLDTPFQLECTEPVTKLNPDLISLVADSLPIPFTPSIDSISPLKIIIAARYKPEVKYQLTLLPGAFTGFLGHQNDTLVSNFQLREENFYGEIDLTILPDEDPGVPMLLQKLSEKGDIQEQRVVHKGEKVIFTRQHPGNYLFRLILDKNNNGKWDPGNYLKDQQPEVALQYVDKVQVRSNWTLDLKWEFKLPPEVR